MDSTKSSDEGSPPRPGPGDADRPEPASNRFLIGRKVLVTGAAGGIGRACAEGFAVAGGEVSVADRAAEAAKHLDGGWTTR
ncbi:SDR family NAD(P)-dependent oxidoreductase [Streptomyces sp. NPDC087787]|uniref:SDR family NAD(P)-dependent oxidoreductase n=1 Tax=Streptomyces sp. NPDC087787 TaxID=3365803 RepID=UPI0037F1DD4B